MKEPDFKADAHRIVSALMEQVAQDTLAPDTSSTSKAEARVERALRETWNVRGVVDSEAIDERFATLTGWGASEPYRNHIRDAIRARDCAMTITPAWKA